MNIRNLHKLFLESCKVETDSRRVGENSIFFALKGENFDGNKFVNSALEKGASLVVTSDLQFARNEKCFYVENTLVALQELAKYHIEYLNIPTIAITGTNGKTTTKELVSAVLSEKYNVGFTSGNFNNHIGVPLTLLSFNKDVEIAVVEMGANHPKEIEFLCEIVKPNFGVITNIGKAHIEGFGSFDAVKNTKKELYDAILKNKGVVFYNSDNKILRTIIGENKTVTYGTKNADINSKLLPSKEYVNIEIFLNNKNIRINTQIFGNYNFENILAAATIGNYFKVDAEKIKYALENYIPKNNRSQIIKKNTNTIILDAYNANPSSMNAAIDNFAEIQAKNKVFILGDMLELGKVSFSEHKNIALKVSQIIEKEKSFSKAYFVGKEFIKAIKSKNLDFEYFESSYDLSEHLKNINFKDSKILIKGSRGIKLEVVLDII